MITLIENDQLQIEKINHKTTKQGSLNKTVIYLTLN